LKDLAGIEHGPEELAVLLTDTGLEVESLTRFENVRGGLRGVVTGEVISCEKHPDADRLTLTRVDTGQGEPLPIVCGAPNVRPGQKVLVARVGATLYTPEGALEIKKARIRGQVSEGMICAEDELGLGHSHDGIMVLPGDTPVGMPANGLFEVVEDWVFEIGLTPNRIDAASHLGVARDILAVVNHRQGAGTMTLKLPDVSRFAPDNRDRVIPVSIEDPAACPRYCGLTVSGLRVQDSPSWLKHRLQAIGLKPINNVVDITNFVLHELGQPLHAFDADRITGDRVIVRKPPKGTAFETLDEDTLELSGEDLMICNEEEPMCMAGILGGIHSGVTAATTNIFLESACFDPVTIRRSSNRYGIKTDASFRFERGADPNMAPVALKRAALLIKEVAGGRISSDLVDVYPVKTEPARVTYRYEQAGRLMGKAIPPEQVKGILRDLDFIVLEEDEQGLLLQVPAYRVDVTREADVVEEVLRIYGYNEIGMPGKLHSSIVLSPKPDKEKLQNMVSDMLSAQGFFEIMNNSLVPGSHYSLPGFDPDRSVGILNPLSQDLGVLRQDLVFGGLEVIAFNQNRRWLDMKLYEFGNIYQVLAAGGTTNMGLERYRERAMLDLWVTGRKRPETWNAPDGLVDFFDLKSAVHNVFQRLGLGLDKMEETVQKDKAPYDYRLKFSLEGETLARAGLLSPAIQKHFDLRNPVYHASFEWERLMALASRQDLRYAEVPRFPEVRRDLALLVNREVSFGAIEKLAYLTGGQLLRQVKLFDVYEDESKLGAGKKSYAVSFVLQDWQKTLTDKEIDKVMQGLSRTFTRELKAEIR